MPTFAPPSRASSPDCPPLARFVDLALHSRPRPAVAAAPTTTAAALFTHHQIVEIAGPFARRGFTLDLAVSDRLRRKLIFRSAERSLAPRSLQETMTLESPHPGHFRLTRTLCEDGGQQATLQTQGACIADLLASLQAVPPQQHFHAGPGYRMASSGCIRNAGSADAGFQLTQAVVQTEALTLHVSVSPSASCLVNSAAVEIQTRRPGDVLPADLLAVLGWDWSLLRAGVHGWQGSVRVRGGPGSGGAGTASKLRLAAAHLARTFAESPRRFEERQRSARLWVLARHAMPLLACAVLGLLALFADALRDARASPLTLALMCVPPALLLVFMLRSERPRLALPTWPRRLAAHAWGDA